MGLWEESRRAAERGPLEGFPWGVCHNLRGGFASQAENYLKKGEKAMQENKLKLAVYNFRNSGAFYPENPKMP